MLEQTINKVCDSNPLSEVTPLSLTSYIMLLYEKSALHPFKVHLRVSKEAY
jgi:hypothetical protein